MGFPKFHFGKSKSKTASSDARTGASVGAYRGDFQRLTPAQPAVDDRANATGDIEMSDVEIANTRFYGASRHRSHQMSLLAQDMEEKTGRSALEKQTVDDLNGRVGITPEPFSYGSLGPIRKMLAEAVYKKAPQSTDEEARAWGAWLAESSRFYALMMPELNSELCRRDMKLDKNAMREPEAGQVDTKEEEDNVERIDHVKKRVYVGDRRRMDDMSYFINSGQTRDVNGEKYEVYWGQEGYRMDMMRDMADPDLGIQENYHTWTSEMKELHEKALQADDSGADEAYQELEAATRRKYFRSSSQKAKEGAAKMTKVVRRKTFEWVSNTVQNRFFRLTSLFGLDFFNSRGNTVQFARDIGQENYDEGAVIRAITDSEWAHAQRMGYTGAGGHVHRVNGRDRFKLKQAGST